MEPLFKIVSIVVFLFYQFSVHPQSSWESLNGPEGGEVRKIYTDSSGLTFAVMAFAIGVSSDNGQSWETIYIDNEGHSFYDIKVNSLGEWFLADSYGLLRSGDMGLTWELITIPTFDVRSIAIDSADNIFISENLTGIHRSTDNGQSWEMILANGYNLKIYGNKLFCAATQQNAGICYSMDGGTNWIIKNVPPDHYSYDYVVIDDNVIYSVGSANNPNFYVIKSTDLGNSWSPDWNSTGDLRVIERIDNFVYIGRFDDGVWYKNLNSNIWSRYFENNGLQNYNITSISNFGSTLVCGTLGDGFYKFNSDSSHWIKSSSGLRGCHTQEIAVDLTDGKLIAGSFGSGLQKFELDTWTDLGLKPTNIQDFIYIKDTIWVVSISSGLFYGGVFRSLDDGSSWDTIPGSILSSGTTINKTTNGYIYVGTYYDGFYRSINNGNNWALLGFTAEYHKDIEITENDIIIKASTGDIGISSDYGVVWNTIGMFTDVQDVELDNSGNIFILTTSTLDKYNLSSQQLTNIALPTNVQSFRSLIATEGKIIVSSWVEGILITEDGGLTWASFNDGLNNKHIVDLEIHGDTIFAASFGTGVYKRIYPGITNFVQENSNIPIRYELLQNYPNPFNSATAIQYSIPQRSNITIKVYDILGNEVATLVNEGKEQGVYTVNFNANNLASGLYLYRIQSGSFIETKKMILLK